jgi:RNA polymerase sigma factor for flagellar operon FliA
MPSTAERDALIAKHRDYARALVLELARSLPRWLDRDELIAVGMQGLVEAAARFDPKRGAAFGTFAYYRVRGAVFDHIRRAAQGDVRARARAAAQAAVDESIQSALADRPRTATEGPVEAAEALFQVIDAAATSFAVSEMATAVLGERTREDVEAEAATREASGAMQAALTTLPEKERAMVRSVYFEGNTIEEAGAALGLSKSWASRLHARALSLLRDAMGARGGTDVAY